MSEHCSACTTNVFCCIPQHSGLSDYLGLLRAPGEASEGASESLRRKNKKLLCLIHAALAEKATLCLIKSGTTPESLRRHRNGIKEEKKSRDVGFIPLRLQKRQHIVV